MSDEQVLTLRLAASAHGAGATGAVLTEAADTIEHMLGVIEHWAKLALDLNTFAVHDDDCSANGLAVEARGCSCGLSKLSRHTTHLAERLVTAQTPQNLAREGEGAAGSVVRAAPNLPESPKP